MTNETKNSSSISDETLFVGLISNEQASGFVAGATFDHGIFDQSEFDQTYDTKDTPFTNETKNS